VSTSAAVESALAEIWRSLGNQLKPASTDRRCSARDLVMPVATCWPPRSGPGACRGGRGAQDQPASKATAGLVYLRQSTPPRSGTTRVRHAPVRTGDAEVDLGWNRSQVVVLDGDPWAVRPPAPGAGATSAGYDQGLSGRGGPGVRAGGVTVVAELGRLSSACWSSVR